MKTRTNEAAPTVRARIGIASLLTVAGLAMPADAAAWHFGAAGGLWSSAGNWIPLMLPTPGADVSIGSTVAAKNGYVLNNISATQNLASLVVSDGMTLHNTSVGNYVVAGTTVVTGMNIEPGPGVPLVYRSRLLLNGVDGNTLATHNLVLNQGGVAELDYAFVNISGALNNSADSFVQGFGVIDLTGAGTTLINNGTIRSHEGNWWLHFRQIGNGVYDLDGTTGNGRLDLTTDSLGKMRFQGSALADSFSGEIDIATGAELRMDLTNGWTADSNSTIDVTTKQGASQLAIIKGGPMTLAGHLSVHGTGGSLILDPSSLIIQPSAVISTTDEWNAVEIGNGANTVTTVNGGDFNVALKSSVRFHGPTTMHGGVFNTASAEPMGLSEVVWFDETNWDGQITVNGSARQVGDATVIGPSVINADSFDMTGGGGASTAWDINNSLVMNVGCINALDNSFTGEMNISLSPFARFTANLADPGDAWTMEGELNIRGGLVGFDTKVAGAPMVVTGDLSVLSGKAQIASNAVFTGDSSISFGTPSSILRTAGDTTIKDGAAFTGQGTLQNGTAGTMWIADGVGLGQAGLVNEGTLHIGALDSLIATDRFSQTASGTLMIDINGTAGGCYSDLLFTGEAALNGVIDVSVLGTTDAAYLPAIGDEFTVLLALGDIDGAFTNDPVSQFGDLTLEWSVLYREHSVVLRLDTIVPSPGPCGVLAAAGACLAVRRNRS